MLTDLPALYDHFLYRVSKVVGTLAANAYSFDCCRIILFAVVIRLVGHLGPFIRDDSLSHTPQDWKLRLAIPLSSRR